MAPLRHADVRGKGPLVGEVRKRLGAAKTALLTQIVPSRVMRLRSSHRSLAVCTPTAWSLAGYWIEAVPGLRRMAILADVNNGTLHFSSLGRSCAWASVSQSLRRP